MGRAPSILIICESKMYSDYSCQHDTVCFLRRLAILLADVSDVRTNIVVRIQGLAQSLCCLGEKKYPADGRSIDRVIDD